MKKKLIAALLAAALVLCALSGCSGKSEENDAPASPAPQTADVQPSDSTAPRPVLLATISDYSDVAQYIGYPEDEAVGGAERNGGFASADMAVKSEEAETAAAESPAPEVGSADYSDTNVQVSGIDESDTVKTDGEYIYTLRTGEGQLVISKADGANTTVVSRTEFLQSKSEDGANGDYYYYNEYAENMYLCGDRLVILKSVYESRYENNEYSGSERAFADIYDISVPEAPVLLDSIGQDGYISDSRMYNGILYLITNYYVSNSDDSDPNTYIPGVYRAGMKTLPAVSDICIPAETHSESWTAVCSVDVASCEELSSVALLGSSGTVYMNAGSLYVAGGRQDCTESQPRTEDQYTVIDYAYSSVTDIMRFSIDDGKVALAASGTVPGSLLNQFSLDEYNGNLRVVTTQYDYSYTTYTDEKYDFVNYKWPENSDKSTSGAYVLDDALNIIGRIDNLAEGERVYSVRFDGDIGYFVTFRQTDPLFTVDFSVPENPTVLSALKIPGFSEYLHVYGDGLLFGLGMAADENGRTEGLKLTMFDTSDKSDVKELATLRLEDKWYSPALYDHHACFVSPEKNIIAFAVDDGYLFFTYENGEFKQLASADTDDYYYSRGLYIGDYFYVVSSNGITILNLADFSKAAFVTF